MNPEQVYLIDSENLLKGVASQIPKNIAIVKGTDQLERNIIEEAYILISAQNKELANILGQYDPQKVFVVSHNEDQLNIEDLLFPNPLFHLVGLSHQLPVEISKTIKKIQKKDLWGIEKYLDDGASIKSAEIFHSKDSQQKTNALLETIDTSLYFDSPKDYLSVVANELISNAFYHMQEVPTTDRTASIFVTGPQAIELKLGIDQHQIALSVLDHSGSLTRDMVVKSLERSYREKTPRQRTPGAGLGLYLTFQHSNQLVFNRAAGKRTEIIAIIEASKRYLNYKQRVTSFHFFEEDSYV